MWDEATALDALCSVQDMASLSSGELDEER